MTKLSCRDYGAQFTFSASEQQFFAEKGLSNEPTRCPACRSVRRSVGAQNSRGSNHSMSHNSDRPMYDAICDSCGAKTKYLSNHVSTVPAIAGIALVGKTKDNPSLHIMKAWIVTIQKIEQYEYQRRRNIP